jgi:hypothetical protein
MTFRQRLALSVAATVIAAVFAAALVVSVPAQPTVSLPFATVTPVTASSVQIIGANPSRRGLQICYPAVAGSVTIAPAPITPVSLTTGIPVTMTATPSTPICFSPPTLTASGTSGGVGAAWNAIGSGAGPFNVTVLEY